MSIRLPRKSPGRKDKRPHMTRPKSAAFFTAADLAERWSMSERHIRRLIGDGELPAHRFGKAVRVSLAHVLIYEASRIAVT